MAKNRLPRGEQAAESAFDEQQKSFTKYTPRFFMKPGETATVIFLDDLKDFVTIEEHVIPVSRNGKRMFDNVTSPHTFGPDNEDPLKDAGSRTARVVYGTLVDTRTWTDRKNNQHKNEKKLVGLKQQAYDVVKRRRGEIVRKTKDSDKPRTLKYAVFEVTRGRGKDVATGSDWQYQGHYTKKQIMKLLAKGAAKGDEVTLDPLDYETIFTPLPEKELELLAKRFAKQAESEDDDDDDSPPAPKKSKKRPVDDEDEDDDGFDNDEDSDEDDADEEEERPKKSKKDKGKKKSKKSKKRDEDEDSDDDVFDEDEDETEDFED